MPPPAVVRACRKVLNVTLIGAGKVEIAVLLRYVLVMILVIPAILCYSVILYDVALICAPLFGIAGDSTAVVAASAVLACVLALTAAYPMVTRFVPDTPPVVPIGYGTYLPFGLALTAPLAFVWTVGLLPLDVVVAMWAVLGLIAFAVGTQFMLFTPHRRTVKVHRGLDLYR